MIKNILIVALGGGLGSVARYFCQKWTSAVYPHIFPFGTFLVNILGCLLIGVFYALAEEKKLLSAEWRLLLITGICGGFTTFSAFALENFSLIKNDNTTYAFLYIGGSVLLSLAATYVGVYFVKLFY